MSNERRLAWVVLASDFLRDWLTGKADRHTSDCPQDIRFLEARWDHQRGALRVLCESAEFRPVIENGECPERVITFMRREKKCIEDRLDDLEERVAKIGARTWGMETIGTPRTPLWPSGAIPMDGLK